MAQIRLEHLTFCYDGAAEPVFEDVSFSVDSCWKLGLIGRNGKGKTTLLRLLMREFPFQGTISAPGAFSYFPYPVTPEQMLLPAAEFFDTLRPDCELWRVICELNRLSADADLLFQPFGTLSCGERTKCLLALLFSGEQDCLLIDEPTNHLDAGARAAVRSYLAQSDKGYILVSHDRDLLDACTDHILVLNRSTISVQSGNFSAWKENKRRADQFAEAENEKHRREIRKLRQAAERTAQWAEKSERTKIGFDPVKEHDRCISTRSFIGAKTKKMQRRVKQTEQRISRAIAEQEGLLQDIERQLPIRLHPLTHHKQLLVNLRDFSLAYGETPVISGLNLEIRQGERIALHGNNGCGKSTLMRAILHHAGYPDVAPSAAESGICETASGLRISYIPQDTAVLHGTVPDFCDTHGLVLRDFCTLLRRLDIPREILFSELSGYSDGQKKKVLLAASLLTPAHLYIWDEPLNYIDIFSRMQIEEMLQDSPLTVLFAEHDIRFREQVGAHVINL